MDDSQLIGAPVENSPATLTVEVKASETVNNVICCSEKRKRGRPPRGAVAIKATTPVKRRREDVEEQGEEDVCFICFDGGSLVLCDRKGCPKAYHPACIKRDEAFFRAAAKWTCGWHICSVCQKTSHNMCYTCTYSVCKGCTKNADYFRVRGNKGFCSTCMRIIMLIENIDQGNKETVQVDFDDKSSWEYLFKVYWMYLKEKLLLTQSELIQAKNHRKELDPVHAKRQRLPFGHRVILDGKAAVRKSFDHLEMKKPKQLLEPPYKDPPSTENQTIAESESLSVSGCTPQMELTQPIELELRSKDSLKTEEESIATRKSLNGSMEWASKELLELVAHMKNGDTSALSHFDVQALLLKYIKRNNLRDPRQKSQIICDARLKGLFGKPRVGHIEMLKLLQFHFLMKEDSQKSAFIPAGIVGTVTSEVEAVDNNDISFLRNKTKKHKSRRSSEEKLVQINLDEYAAIDVHNINLIYLRRDLMESLIEDMEKFHGKVIGSVVRIRISSSDQKQEMYRLVHVVGTSVASVPYKIRDKTANVLLEVLNLNKKETVPIDSISNQDFCEDECRRLRQIIKCGLVKRLTIGEIQKKAIDLRAVKLNDSLEAEILRLNHLRDRASEKGRRKELRECVEKLELLKAPEERQQRLLTIPEVHADPKMDPSYESEEDAGESEDIKQVEYLDPRYTKFSRREDKLMSSVGKVKEESIMARHKFSEKGEAHGNNILKKLGNQGTACQVVDMSSSETSTASISTANSTSTKNSETEKLWHYRDPSGRIQGPFSVMQLRKWNKSGLFPPNMRIWTNDEHDDSVLLTNALNGLFHKASRVHGEMSHQSQPLGAPSVNNGVGAPLPLHITRNCSNVNTETMRMDGSSSSFRRCLALNNSYSDKTQPSCSVPSPSHGDVYVAASHGKRCHEMVNFHSSTSHVVQDSSGSTISQISDGNYHSIQSNNQRHLGQSSEQNQGSLTSSKSSANMNSGSSFASVTKASNCTEQKGIKGFPDLPSPTPETSYDDIEAQAAEELLSLSSGIQVCASDIQDLPSPTPHLKGETRDGQAAAKKESFPSSSHDQDSGPSWSSACSLEIGGTLPPEATNEGDGCSPASRPSVDSGLVSNSSLKSAEAVGDHVDTPTSDANLKAETPDDQAAAKNESFPSNFPVQDSGPSWSSTCSLVIGGTQLPEITNEGGGCSPASRPSVDSGLVSDSSLKPAEAVGDHIDTPTSDANPKAETLDGLAAAKKESFPSSFPVQDSGPSWSSTCSLVIGGTQLLEITNEGGGPSVDSGLVSDSSLKPAEAVGDHVDTPTSDANQLNQTSPSNTVSSFLGWEPIEFTTLDEESVSDLLAEVDAMESHTQSGMGSPTSDMRCSDEMISASISDCFSSIEELSPSFDPAKNDALSSTDDVQLPFRSSLIDELAGASQTDAFDPLKRSSGKSSSSSEGETKSADVSFPHGGAGSNVATPYTTSRETAGSVIIRSTGVEAIDTGCRAAPGNMTWHGAVQGYGNVGHDGSMITAWGNSRLDCAPFTGNPVFGSQCIYSGEGSADAGPRDWVVPVGDLGFGRESSYRQPFGAGCGYSRPPPKGQQVCKFYDSGHCRKGASCDYLHLSVDLPANPR